MEPNYRQDLEGSILSSEGYTEMNPLMRKIYDKDKKKFGPFDEAVRKGKLREGVKIREKLEKQEQQIDPETGWAFKYTQGSTIENHVSSPEFAPVIQSYIGSKPLDDITAWGEDIFTKLQLAAEQDPDTYRDELVRLGFGGLEGLATVVGLPGIKQALQVAGLPASLAGKLLGAGFEQAGIDPRYGQILGEVGEMFIPGYGAFKLAGKLKKAGLSTKVIKNLIKQVDNSSLDYDVFTKQYPFLAGKRGQGSRDYAYAMTSNPKSKGFGDPTGQASSKFYNTIWDNLSVKVQKLFEEVGITNDKAAFFIEKWTEGPVPRELAANIEGLPFTDSTFNFMKSKLLPEILEDMKGIKLSKGRKLKDGTPILELELDHIAQLRAMLPFYQGRNLEQAEKIRRILIKEGIFGGHNPQNLKYLPKDVHTVKTRFWEDQVGKDGSKFFKGRPMKTYEDVEKAAKEMKQFINRSNTLIETVSEQYRFMRKKTISSEDLESILKKVDLNYGTYNLKEVRQLIKDINVDILERSEKGFKDAERAAKAVEYREKKTFLPHEIEDRDLSARSKKSQVRQKNPLQEIAKKEFNKEQKRLEQLGGQTELPLDDYLDE